MVTTATNREYSAEELREGLVALERSRHHETELRLETEALLEALQALTEAQNTREVFDNLIHVLRRFVPYEDALLLAETSTGQLESTRATAPVFEELTWRVGNTLRRVLDGRIVTLHDIRPVPEWQEQPEAVRSRVRSAMLVPLRTGTTCAILVFVHSQPAFFSKSHAHLLERFAPLTNVGLASIESRQELLREIAERERVAEKLRLSDLALQNSGEAILITDRNNTIMSVNAAFTDITGFTADEVVGKNPRLLSAGRHEAAFYVQMWDAINKTGRWEGEIWDRRKNGEVYPKWLTISTIQDKQGATSNYVGIFADISERKAAEEKIRHLAHFDHLTGLPNRALLRDRVDQALAARERDRQPVALLFIDLDHFKTINDSLGHHVGDLLLQAVAERLQRCTRTSDTVSRLGGDEFVIVLPEIESADNAAKVAEKILGCLGAPYNIAEHHLNTTPSIGISLFPEDGSDADTLMRNADSAMYSAKTGGRNNFRFFTQNMNERALARLAMEDDLRQALAGGWFRLHYQPQVSVTSGRIVGVEALIRLQHPVRGLIPPAQFISIAEEAGLITAIGDWVLQEACRQNVAWQAAGLPAIPIAVNLSALQFQQRNLPEKIRTVLHETGLSPSLLELELTESVIMQDAEMTIAMLRELKAMGLQMSVDDFGTGYSSLKYLKHFPIDKLKVDQSFVRDITSDPDDAAIVSAIIGMGHSLRLVVIAEGVETEGQMNYLRQQQCNEIQGYLFSKPLPAEQFAQLLSEGRMLSMSTKSEE